MRSRLTSPPVNFRSSYISQFSKLRQDISTTHAGILALGTSGSAAVGVEGGIEISPITGNGQKMAILGHLCPRMRLVTTKNGFSIQKYIKMDGRSFLN